MPESSYLRCDECDQQWLAYAAVILRCIHVRTLTPFDEQLQKTADLAWEKARTAVENHIATHG